MTAPAQPAPIAVVGLGCEYPDAHSPDELWENVLAGRRAFRRLPAERVRIEDYWSADRGAADRLYATEAAVIEGYEFDRVAMRVPGPAYRAADLVHWLALDVALRALADAGATGGDGLPRDTTGVVLGNTLTGELTRAGTMRLRWPYVRRVVEAALGDERIEAEQRSALMRRIEAAYKAPFEPVGDETLAGALSNTIAGRICNHLDLHGGGYTVDGACAASLLATATACERLASGELDVALAGGVDVSLDPFELVGFAKAGALAASEMRVYDERSEGFWPGEGCGFVVLMRLDDALAAGRRIHAVVRGWGVSSDGAGGITRPELGGQLLAIRRAYARARLDARAVGYFEGHGTGTAVGDATELHALAEARRGADASAALGSIKANIGHTKAAAGVAGLIKAVVALREGVLPPTTGCTRPHAALEGSGLRVLRAAEPWSASERLAGVSAMGFGGINSHAVLGAPPEAVVRTRLAGRERRLAASSQDCELFVFAATSRGALLDRVERLAARAPALSRAELGDAAAALAQDIGGGGAFLRAAVVAGRPAELAERLDALAALLRSGAESAVDGRDGVFLGVRGRPPRIGFLLPGQGSPAHLGGGALRRRFRLTEELFAASPSAAPGGDETDTTVAQPGIVAASLAALRVLESLGIAAEVAVGHSLGELTALAWAGALDECAAQRIATERGRAMGALAGAGGSMAGVGLDREGAERLAAGLDLRVAGLNAPDLTVLSGAGDAVAALVARARERGVSATQLRVSHAFHSPLVEPAADALRSVLEGERVGSLRRRVVSTVTGTELGSDDDLRALLVRQVTAPVQFERAARLAAADLDLLVEAGPGGTLSGLARRFLDVPAIATDAGGPSLAGLLSAAGAAWALGAPLDAGALFADRFTRPLDLDRTPSFIANPCESAPLPDAEAAVPVAPKPPAAAAPEPEPVADGLELVRELVAARAELPPDAVTDGSRLLDDLHLSSIVVSELAIDAARRLGRAPPAAPNEFANVTIAGLAQALGESEAGGAVAPDAEPPGAGPWVRSFAVEWRARPRRPEAGPSERGRWGVLAAPGDPLAAPLEQALGGGDGTAVVLPPGPLDHGGLPLLLEGTRAAATARGAHAFLLVHHGSGATGFARTLHQEAPAVRVCIVDAAPDGRTAQRAAAEMAATRDFAEVSYAADGTRREPVLRHLPLDAGTTRLGPGDVVLATGGAKGIAAECVLALVRETGAAVGIVGRSDAAGEGPVAENLERMAAAGVRVRYARADVTDAAAVAAAVAEMESALGPVTAVVHAAGSNEPRRLAELDEAHVRAAIAPKAGGLRNVLEAVDAGRLRLLVSFGSIIARIGMRGDAHYALANELQTQLTERFAAEHPDCACLAFESSVWGAVGMGERLGAVSALARQGVDAIAPEAGAPLLARLAAQRERPVAVVVAGRFGRPRELALDESELPLARFLERTPVHYPGIELVAEAELSADVDPYLDDHVLEGERVLPAVIALEAMAQAAAGLRGGAAPPSFEDVRFHSALVVPPGEPATLRVAALADDRGDGGRVALRSGRTAFAVEHASARWRAPAEGALDVSELPTAGGDPVPLDPADLYGSLFFQSGRFQRLRRYLRLTATTCVAEIDPRAPAGWFGRFLPQALLRGDPGVRDAALHALQACIPHARVIPVSVAAIRPGTGGGPGPWRVHARERARAGPELTWDMAIVAADGRVVERWDGLTLREVAAAPPPQPWAEPLLANYLERKLDGVRVALTNGGGTPRERSDRAIRMAAGHCIDVRRRPDGRPETHGAAVSTAHAGGLTLAVAGAGRLACDLEPVTPRPDVVWRDVLGPERSAVQGQAGDDGDAAATRVWAAIECLRKAGLPGSAPLTVAERTGDGWLELRSGPLAVATYVTRVRGVDGSVALAVLAAGDDAQL